MIAHQTATITSSAILILVNHQFISFFFDYISFGHFMAIS